MTKAPSRKIQSVAELYSMLPENQRIIVDFLRSLVRDSLPQYCREKISYNVPFFYGNKSICIIWPAAIPRGGIREGVLLGFWYGNRLPDKERYLTHGTNKQVFYKVFKNVDEINSNKIISLLAEAVVVDQHAGKRKSR